MNIISVIINIIILIIIYVKTNIGLDISKSAFDKIICGYFIENTDIPDKYLEYINSDFVRYILNRLIYNWSTGKFPKNV